MASIIMATSCQQSSSQQPDHAVAVSNPHGFSCEFVEKPPEAVQSDCPVCLQVLREPYQAPCCGKSFCRVCIERVKTDKKPCPTCNKENFVIFHNKGLQLSLYSFQVYCSHKQEGCEWKGELGQLDNHLNLSPHPDKQLEGCEYSEIKCIYCSELIKRSRVAFHQTEHCDKRPFSCEYCHSYESTYEDVIHNHWPVCGYHPVRCPNECGTFPQRQALENHVTKDCPETVIDCDFHHVGCNVKLPRKDIPAHLNENLVTHMSLQATHQSGMLATLQNRVNKLESENKTLKQQMEEQIDTLKAASEKSQQMDQEMKAASEKNQQMEQEMKAASEKNQQMEQEMKAASEKSQQMEQETALLKAASEKNHQIEQEMKAACEKSQQMEQEIALLKVASEKSQQMEQEMKAASEKSQQMEQEMKAASEKSQQMEQEMKAASEKSQQMEQEMKAASEKSQQMEQEMKAASEKSQQMEQEMKAASEKSQQMEQEMKAACEKSQQMEQEIALLKATSEHKNLQFDQEIVMLKADNEHLNLQLEQKTAMLKAANEHTNLQFDQEIAMVKAANGATNQKFDQEFAMLKVASEHKHQHYEQRIFSLQAASDTVVQYIGIPVAPDGHVGFTMMNFTHHKKQDDEWYSPPLYSHLGGYKLCVSVDANGSMEGKGTHVSVWIYLMRGEFDDKLKWPFRGFVDVSLLDQEGGKEHHTYRVKFDKTVTNSAATRVTGGERNRECWGDDLFISNDKLQKHLKNDCLCFKIKCLNVGV